MVPVRRQMWPPFLIFTFIASPPKPLEEFRRNLAFEFLSMSRCVRPKMGSVCQKQMAIFRIVNCSLLNTVTISLPHLLRDHCGRSHQIFCILQLGHLCYCTLGSIVLFLFFLFFVFFSASIYKIHVAKTMHNVKTPDTIFLLYILNLLNLFL